MFSPRCFFGLPPSSAWQEEIPSVSHAWGVVQWQQLAASVKSTCWPGNESASLPLSSVPAPRPYRRLHHPAADVSACLTQTAVAHPVCMGLQIRHDLATHLTPLMRHGNPLRHRVTHLLCLIAQKGAPSAPPSRRRPLRCPGQSATEPPAIGAHRHDRSPAPARSEESAARPPRQRLCPPASNGPNRPGAPVCAPRRRHRRAVFTPLACPCASLPVS